MRENLDISESFRATTTTHRFGGFRLDAADRRLWSGSERVQLTPKQFDLLLYLVENAGRTARKDELLDAVWADIYIEETTLARNVSWLRQKLAEYDDSQPFIETVPKLGYRFAADVTRTEPGENVLIIEEQIIQHIRGEETISVDEVFSETAASRFEPDRNAVGAAPQIASARRSLVTPRILIAVIVIGALAVVGYVAFKYNSNTAGGSGGSNAASDKPLGVAPVSADSALRIGSVIHLKSQVSDDAGYLDVWGEIKRKPEFKNIPTQIKFVSTHPNPNRDNGSGSWKIVSARGKKDGEGLVYGDGIHLQSMFPNGGYLDNCGWVVDMPILKAFVNSQKFAVSTTGTKDRDRGTGTWTVGSNTEYDGSPVREGQSITLENGFPVGGFLNAQGFVVDIPAFNDYDGAHLVFIRVATTARRPDSGNWTISASSTPPISY